MMRRVAFSCVIGGVLLMVWAGCTGLGRSGDITPLDISTRFLAVPATVPPIDSLHHVHLGEGNDHLEFETEYSFGRLQQQWSSGYRVERGLDLLEAGRMRSFATLWSREMRLVQFDQRTSIGAYPREEARRKIASRVDVPHSDVILIDVHVYIDRRVRASYGATNLRSARWDIFLRTDAGTEYRPDGVDATWARPMRWSNEDRAHYRHNTLRFDRTDEKDRDILQGVDRLELHIRDSVASTDLLFGWRFEQQSETE